MKVRELIEYLKEQDPEAEVHFVYDYGDYWHTMVAPQVKVVEEGRVIYSEYHRMPTLLDNDYRHDQAEEVVVLAAA